MRAFCIVDRIQPVLDVIPSPAHIHRSDGVNQRLVMLSHRLLSAPRLECVDVLPPGRDTKHVRVCIVSDLLCSREQRSLQARSEMYLRFLRDRDSLSCSEPSPDNLQPEPRFRMLKVRLATGIWRHYRRTSHVR